ncbi:MAG TPA: T9SS type A sorting domain-containing protein, partial [Chitinophagaceae bacterium]|nr:T9SS type A sorting domain-containing protein [Chitinophagaceae bacterium]
APLKGMNYYRVKQVDMDGKYSYSNIAVINFERGNAHVTLYPNPAKHTLNVEYTAIRNNKISVQVIDARGSVILQSNYTATIGKNIHSLNVSSLTKGVYMLKTIDTDGNITVSKFIKD